MTVKNLVCIGIVLSLLLVSACTRARNDSPIRKIDFRNFTYPSIWTNDELFTLKDGRHGIPPLTTSLIDTIYGDVTGDGAEEAMLVLTESVRGTAIPYYVYVYGIDREQPKLLWSFDTGDRAQGGLRRVFAENGNLVVELYGKDTYLGGDIFAGSAAACCASHYTRARYEWKDNHFQRIRQSEVLTTEGGAPYLKSVRNN